jgi:hypothetical protein
MSNDIMDLTDRLGDLLSEYGIADGAGEVVDLDAWATEDLATCHKIFEQALELRAGEEIARSIAEEHYAVQ